MGTEQKLVYINEGEIVEYLKLKFKYSKNYSQGNFIGQFSFFTGVHSHRVHVETTTFTVCQTISYPEFKQKIK